MARRSDAAMVGVSSTRRTTMIIVISRVMFGDSHDGGQPRLLAVGGFGGAWWLSRSSAAVGLAVAARWSNDSNAQLSKPLVG